MREDKKKRKEEKGGRNETFNRTDDCDKELY